jgi:O-antigen ligase
MAASTLWSYSRVDTVRDVLTFLVIAFAALVLVQIASLNTLAIGVALSGTVLLAWALLLIAVEPDAAFTPGGALLGPYGNRNGMAYALLQSVPAALGMRLAFRFGFVIKSLVVVSLSAGIVATTSKTSLLVVGVLLAGALAIVLVRRRRIFGIVLAGVGVPLVAIGAANFGRILTAFGKGDTINGRTSIWEALLPLIGQRPLTGFGWSMAWPVNGPPSGDVRWRLDGVTVYHAHNEILNWLITTGIPGTLLVVAVYVLVFRAGIKLSLGADLVAAAWIPLGALALILRGLSDISETLPQGWFILMILAAASVKYLPEALGHRLPYWQAIQIRVGEPAAVHGNPNQK